MQVADACIATLGINIASYVITEEPVGIVISNELSGLSSGYVRNPETLIKAGTVSYTHLTLPTMS